MNPLSDPSVQETLRGAFRLVLPEIVLIGTACVAFLFGSAYNRRGLWFFVSLLGVAAAAIVAGAVKASMPSATTAAPIVLDAAAAFVRWVALAAAAVFVFVSWSEVDRSNAAEYYGCLLLAAAGTSLVGRANDLTVLYLALELLSIPTYILLYLPSRTQANQEAATKYFLLSILSSAMLLFGFSYLYGLSGTTNITATLDSLTRSNAERLSPLALVAIALVIAALGFRIAAVPFHFYAPDVYEGAPTGVVAQIAFFPKVVGFVALARLLGFLTADPRHIPFDARTQIPLLLWILAVVTMTFGNALALLQNNIRRMLAYSSVAHGGYMLIGLVVASSLPDAHAYDLLAPSPARSGAIASAVMPIDSRAVAIGGVDAVLVHLVAYGAMTVGAFAVIAYLSSPGDSVESIDDLAGLGRSRPVAAATLAVFAFSLIGLPLTAGFVGKLLLFVGAFTAPADTPAMRNLYQSLAVVAAVNAAIAAYYYLRIVGVMYLRSPIRTLATSRSVPTLIAAVALAGVTLVFGVYPQPLVKAARHAVPAPTKPPDLAK